ncbi:hypothetical protein ABIE66_004782 [Peribacillus sp. B2I2]|uniref:hypothetical protein n=1 Tax=Peribacillus sp. B2I2 TaxID=3156468 RepID=UPI0035139F85
MKKVRFMIFGLFLYCITSTVSYASAEGTVDDTVNLQVKQNLFLEIPKDGGTPEEIEELINIYESAGWIADGDFFIKEVNQQNVVVEYAGDTYHTSPEGTVQIPVEESQGEEIEVLVNSVGDEMDPHLVEVDKVSTTKIVQDIYLDEILEEMGNPNLQEEEQVTETTDQNASDIVGSVSAGTSYSRGATVHCNRFNGYLGDGKYYDKFDHPVLAAKNFVQSDCDVALFWYTYCLKDYGEASKRYCSNYTSSNKGKCSILSKVGHSRKYHKHTGFFSPSS